MAWLRGSYHHLPLWVASGAGARFTDVDGFTYSDFNIADMSMFCGYAPEPVVRALSERMARGNQFLLPTEDAIVVAEELGRRYGLPKWQFTLSATQANTEVIRVARVLTSRDKVLMFDGKYHGHFDQALVAIGPDGALVPEEHGLPADVTQHSVLVPFNDLDAVAGALDRGDIALVLTEPAMTNNVGLILPQDGFHEGLRRLHPQDSPPRRDGDDPAAGKHRSLLARRHADRDRLPDTRRADRNHGDGRRRIAHHRVHPARHVERRVPGMGSRRPYAPV